jgi:nucleotide-binding universal stress UspA family protein
MDPVPKTILAATDFSETADKAARLARDLGRRFDAHIRMLHVVVILDDAHLEDEHRRHLDELMESTDETRRTVMENDAEARTGVDISSHLVRGIAPGETIVESATNLGCDLIVMGTHGRRGLSHLLLGSVAERVVRTSTVPVLTVRSDATINPDGVRRILVPHDFSEASATAIRFAVAWARALDAEITLLHVVEPVVYPEFYSVDVLPDDLMGRLTTRSEEALQKAAAELAESVPTRTAVAVGRAAETITAFGDPDDFDLVVMATRGLSGLEHVLLGSVAESVLRRCRVPMLTIPG